MSGFVIQAGCVAIGSRALLIEGAPGSGKSSLALALIDRGAALVGDDGVTLTPAPPELPAPPRLLAGPPPNTAGLIEIRNVGIARLPVAAGPVPVALVLRLDPAAPRHVECAETLELGGFTLPLVRLWPGSPVLPLRAEWALRLHGLA